MAKPIILREYWTLTREEKEGPQSKPLSKQEWKEVRDYVLNNPDKYGRKVMDVRADEIRAENYVGVIQTNKGTPIEILPKIDLDHGEDTSREREIFLQMLRHWRNGPCRHFSTADVRAMKNFPLLEAFIGMFMKDLLELTRRGLACAYSNVEENHPYLKGKLLITEHLRHNLAHKERFYVQYDEFSPNRPINQLLKSTLLLLQRKSRSETNLAHIRQARLYFEDIPESQNIDADLTRAQVDRTMPLYRRLFPWARLFLKKAAPATWHADNLALALLFPMESIFEDYVAHLIRKAAPSGWEISTQESPHCLMNKNPNGKPEFHLRPDIVARNDTDDRVRIMDTKWKRLDTNKKQNHYDISQTDLYQLYAYGKKYQAHEQLTPELYLLYPRNKNFNKKIEFEYENGLHLTAFPVDLTAKEGAAEKTSGEETLHTLFEPSTSCIGAGIAA